MFSFEKIFLRLHNCKKLCIRNLKDTHMSRNGLHSSKFTNTSIKECHEIKIPVPWGHIAGKWWGNRNAQPVLALHGVQDNAATFDKLIPLLDAEAVLALDIPGHGLSSHIPKGFTYDFMDAVCIVRFVIHHHYKWAKPVVLLGHSFGSSLSFVYSAVYTDKVSKYISIDCARHQMSITPDRIVDEMRNTLEKTLNFEDKNPPEYSYDELLEMLYQGRKCRLSKDNCKILLSRGLTKLDNGKVYLSRDVRLKLNAFGLLTNDSLLSFASKIKCPMLSIQAEKGTVNNNSKGEIYKKTIDTILKNSPNSKHIIMPGGHHLHLDNPEPVAVEINKFLST